MSFHITRRDMDKAMSAFRSARDTLAPHKARVESVAGQAVQSGVINGAAFLTGLAQGRFGPMLLPGGIPAAAAVGAGLHVAGFFGLGGKHNEALHNAADGMLASYSHLLGMGFGGKLRTSAGLPAIWGDGRVSGALGAGAAPVSDAELAALSRSVR